MPQKITLPLLAVLRYLIEHQKERPCGNEVAGGCRLSTGTVYAVLYRLGGAGWAVHEDEVHRRKVRWSLTAGGLKAARAVVAARSVPGGSV